MTRLEVEVQRAVAALGRSKRRRAVFAAIYYGKKPVKTVSEVAEATDLDRKQVLTYGKQLADDKLVEQVKKDGDTAYRKLGSYARHKERILREAASSRSSRTTSALSNHESDASAQAASEKKGSPTCRRLPIQVFDCCSLHPEVCDACRSLFRDGHYEDAVGKGVKLYINTVKEKAGQPTDQSGKELDGTPLMGYVFRSESPTLRINPMLTESHKKEQRGYMQLAQGAVLCIRNPRAHEHQLKDDRYRALELLGFVSYLMRRLDTAKRK